jgi:hypothetical protein
MRARRCRLVGAGDRQHSGDPREHSDHFHWVSLRSLWYRYNGTAAQPHRGCTMTVLR